MNLIDFHLENNKNTNTVLIKVMGHPTPKKNQNT